MRRSALRRTADAGFTLIELLIVIVILGILAAIVVFSVSGLTTKASTNSCQIEVSEVDTAIEAYYADFGGYPAQMSDLVGPTPTTPSYVTQTTPVTILLHSTPTYVAISGGTKTTAPTVSLTAAGTAAGNCTAS